VVEAYVNAAEVNGRGGGGAVRVAV
jgi:hypothetical protein